MLSTLSQEEIELNMQLLAKSKAQQVRQQQQSHEEEENRPNLNESSFLEDVMAESSNQSDTNQAESSLKNVEVADQSVETSPHHPTLNQSESSLEEVEVADQSLETSFQNGAKSLHNRDDDESSMEEVEVADQSLETSAIDDGESSFEEVEVADQSQETSIHHQEEDAMNVSMKSMQLEDDVVNLSMEDLAKADTLDVCDNLDLHIPTPKKGARKSSSILAPSPLAQPNQKKRHPSSLLSMMNDSTASNTSLRVERTNILVDDSPVPDTPVSDESETRKKRKSDERLSSSDEKRKYVQEEVEDDDDDDDSLPWRCGARRERPMRLQDLDESEQDNSVFMSSEEGITVIQESDEETADDSFENAPSPAIAYESEHGSYLTDSRKKNPLSSVQNDSTSKLPTPREMLRYTFDDTPGEQSKLDASKRMKEVEEKKMGSHEDDTMGWTKSEEDFGEKTRDDEQVDLEHDETVDASMENDTGDGEELEEEKTDGDTTNEDIQDDDEEEEDAEGEEDAESMTLNSEEESYEDEDEDYGEEEDDDEYSKLVTQGEQYHSNGNEPKALECFLQALKIDKSDRTLQIKTLALYQKVSKK